MQINMQIRFSTEDFSWLCFNHAVAQVIKGIEVKTEIDEFSSDYYMGPIHCKICRIEADLKTGIVSSGEK